MADRTPRIAYANFAQLSQTLVTASAADASFPSKWTKDRMLSKPWRTPTGWTVGAHNNKLDFNRGGVLVATVASGYYPTADLLAAAVQAALTAADGATTWSVTYDPGTHKFTISGSAAFTLLAATGANLVAAIFRDLGFNAVDKTTGGTSTWTGDTVSYQSRAWVLFDLVVAQAVTVLIATGHLGIAGAGSITVRGATTSAWGGEPFSQLLAGDARLMAAWISTQTYRFWRFIVDDVENVAGYVQLSVPFVGAYFQPSRSVARNFRVFRGDLTQFAESDSGAFFQDKRATRHGANLSFPRLRYAERAAFEALADYLGLGRPFFFAMDPLNRPFEETRYVVIADELTFQQSIGDGDPPERWTVGMNVLEAVG